MKAFGILVMFVVFFGGLGSASAQEAKSPFMRPSKKVTAPVKKTTAASPLDSMEFNGVVEIGGVAWLSLYDPQAKKSYWLSKEEAAEDGITLEAYDKGSQRGEETIMVRQGIMTRRLSLKDADIISLKEAPRPAVQRATQRAGQPQAPQRAQQPKAMEAATDEEVRERMQRVAEEIRRRRTLRQNVVEPKASGSN
ncbi:MAG: hypothetical protein ACKVGW_02560 [Verrucomicrobiia bacterium]|jgi:hypothetical protein